VGSLGTLRVSFWNCARRPPAAARNAVSSYFFTSLACAAADISAER